MSTPPPTDLPPGSSDDLLAAEYVLGTLPGPERRDVAQRIDVDAAFARLVRDWENRLAPLNDHYAEVTAPDVLAQVEARLFGAPKSARGRAWGWPMGLLAGALTAMLALAVFVYFPRPADTIILQAELSTEADDLRFAVAWDSGQSLLQLTRVAGQAAPDGQDYELWQIGADGVPQSLGLLREDVTQLQVTLQAGITLAISLEPAGGSPDPVPSGPVLAAAPLIES